MNEAPTRVLLIEDNVADSELVAQALASTTGPPFYVERLAREVFELELDLPCLMAKVSKPWECVSGQGFLFSHPLAADDLARLLAGEPPRLLR